MIDLIFYYGTEVLFMNINHKQVMFKSISLGNRLYDIRNLAQFYPEKTKMILDEIEKSNTEQEVANLIKEEMKEDHFILKGEKQY